MFETTYLIKKIYRKEELIMLKSDRLFLDIAKRIKKEGIWDKNPRPKYSDGTPAHSIYIDHVVCTYDISKGELPLITLRPIAIKNAIKEILWIYQDQSNDLNVLKDKYGIKWWDLWESKSMPGTIGKRYGATIREYDLMNKLLDGLKNDPCSRRHIIDMWQESDFKETDGLNPCAFMTMWTVRNDYLDLMLVQRSSDFLTAFNINEVQYVALLMMVARHCGYKPGKFTHVINNVHIYDRHMQNLEDMLNRKPIDCFPVLTLNTDKTNFYDFTIDDFVLEGYESVKPQLKFDLGI